MGMEAFPSPAPVCKSGLCDLPDGVIVMIVKHLSFEEKTMLRLVSKYLKTAVEYVYANQLSVKIILEPRTPIWIPAVRRNWACDHKFDSGFSVTFFYPLQNVVSSDTERCQDGQLRSFVKNEFTPETGEKKRAFFRFLEAISFTAKYFTSLAIVKIVCNITRSNVIAYKHHAGLTPESVCNELIDRYSHQLQCIHGNVLVVTENHFSLRLQHLGCLQVSCSIEHLFLSASRLVSSHSWGLCLTEENYQHLPKGLLSLTTSWKETGGQNAIALALKSAVRESIVCLNTNCPTAETDEIADEIFPNLKSLSILAAGRRSDPDAMRRFFARTSSRLSELVIWFRFLDMSNENIQFQNLQTLGYFNQTGQNLIAILNKAPNLRNLSVKFFCCFGFDITSTARVFTTLASMKKLETVALFGSIPADHDAYAAALTFLRGESRSSLTFCLLRFKSGSTDMPIDSSAIKREILLEMQNMTKTASLRQGVFGRLSASQGMISHVPLLDFQRLYCMTSTALLDMTYD